MTTRRIAFWAFVGVAVAVAIQFLVPPREGVRWWLDTTNGVEIGGWAFFVSGVAAGLTMPWPFWTRGEWLPALWLWAGANLGLTAAMFAIEPGHLFPIVMAFGALITLWAIVGGLVVGAVLQGLADAIAALLPRTSP